MLALDLRGRGRSGYDRDPANYKIAVETDDVVTVMTALAVGPAIFVGTSRGGLVTMTLATKRLDLIAGVVLNDIGPVVDTAGVMRIKSYVGKLRPTGELPGGRGHPARHFGRPVSQSHRRGLARRGKARLARGRRPARRHLRSRAHPAPSRR